MHKLEAHCDSIPPPADPVDGAQKLIIIKYLSHTNTTEPIPLSIPENLQTRHKQTLPTECTNAEGATHACEGTKLDRRCATLFVVAHVMADPKPQTL